MLDEIDDCIFIEVLDSAGGIKNEMYFIFKIHFFLSFY